MCFDGTLLTYQSLVVASLVCTVCMYEVRFRNDVKVVTQYLIYQGHPKLHTPYG